MKTLFISGLLSYALFSFGQSETLEKEAITENCLNEKVPLTEWNFLTNYFESYLITNGFGIKSNIESAYLKFIDYRTGYPPKPLPPLQDRIGLKEKLLTLKIIDNSSTYGTPFVKCFYQLNQEYNDYPESTFKNIVSISESISLHNLSSNMIMGGLKVSLNETDIKKSIYKRVIILLGLIDIIYIEEIMLGQASDDNPIFRRLQEKENQNKGTSSENIKHDHELDKEPKPSGGINPYLEWIYDNNKKLDRVEKLGTFYRTIVSIEIDEKGIPTVLGVTRGIGIEYDTEAYRLIKSHPTQKWVPGTVGGKPTKVKVDIEVDFRIK